MTDATVSTKIAALKPAALARRLWAWLREATGDDAYERYLEHWRAHHGNDSRSPLTPREFHRRREDARWRGINRCC
jgi:uncharacterized short protein YbdD (DUF466 family)